MITTTGWKSCSSVNPSKVLELTEQILKEIPESEKRWNVMFGQLMYILYFFVLSFLLFSLLNACKRVLKCKKNIYFTLLGVFFGVVILAFTFITYKVFFLNETILQIVSDQNNIEEVIYSGCFEKTITSSIKYLDQTTTSFRSIQNRTEILLVMIYVLGGFALLCLLTCGINDYSGGKCFKAFLTEEDSTPIDDADAARARKKQRKTKK